MMHPELRWDGDGLWPGNHNSVSGDCGFFATSDRAAKCVHIPAFARRALEGFGVASL
jgi:hypothetical protein